MVHVSYQTPNLHLYALSDSSSGGIFPRAGEPAGGCSVQDGHPMFQASASVVLQSNKFSFENSTCPSGITTVSPQLVQAQNASNEFSADAHLIKKIKAHRMTKELQDSLNVESQKLTHKQEHTDSYIRHYAIKCFASLLTSLQRPVELNCENLIDFISHLLLAHYTNHYCRCLATAVVNHPNYSSQRDDILKDKKVVAALANI